MNKAALITAVQVALDGDWDKSHNIAQDYSDPIANWIHAVLHKVEGNVWNSKYWYAKTAGKHYAEFDDAVTELKAILSVLEA